MKKLNGAIDTLEKLGRTLPVVARKSYFASLTTVKEALHELGKTAKKLERELKKIKEEHEAVRAELEAAKEELKLAKEELEKLKQGQGTQNDDGGEVSNE